MTYFDAHKRDYVGREGYEYAQLLRRQKSDDR
jgi:hypothetical protein